MTNTHLNRLQDTFSLPNHSKKHMAVYSFSLGNLKTLTPTTDRVHGLPMDRSTDYPYGPLYGPPQK